MKQIIEEVFQAEQKVDVILKQARQKASQIKLDADKAGADKINQARQQAQEVTKTIIDKARQEAESLRDEKLKQAEAKKNIILQDGDAIDKLIDDIINTIVVTGYDTDNK